MHIIKWSIRCSTSGIADLICTAPALHGDVLHLHIPNHGVDVVENQRVLAVIYGHTPLLFTVEGGKVWQGLHNLLIAGRKKEVWGFPAINLCPVLQYLLIGCVGPPFLIGPPVLVHIQAFVAPYSSITDLVARAKMYF